MVTAIGRISTYVNEYKGDIMKTKIKIKETELYPVYDRAFLVNGTEYEVEVESWLEKEYFDALAQFESVLDYMEQAVSGQIDKQKYKKQ